MPNAFPGGAAFQENTPVNILCVTAYGMILPAKQDVPSVPKKKTPIPGR